MQCPSELQKREGMMQVQGARVVWLTFAAKTKWRLAAQVRSRDTARSDEESHTQILFQKSAQAQCASSPAMPHQPMQPLPALCIKKIEIDAAAPIGGESPF